MLASITTDFALAARTIARRKVERPIVLVSGDPEPDAWNIVKSNSATTVFDVTSGTKGPIEKDVAATSDHQLLIHLGAPILDAKDFAALFTLGDSAGDVYEIESSGGGTGQAKLEYYAVTEDWTPSTVNWDNKPTSLSLLRRDNFVASSIQAGEAHRAQKVTASVGLTAKRIIRVTSAVAPIYGFLLKAVLTDAGFTARITEVTGLAISS